MEQIKASQKNEPASGHQIGQCGPIGTNECREVGRGSRGREDGWLECGQWHSGAVTGFSINGLEGQ